jgi:hypothetical protein
MCVNAYYSAILYLDEAYKRYTPYQRYTLNLLQFSIEEFSLDDTTTLTFYSSNTVYIYELDQHKFKLYLDLMHKLKATDTLESFIALLESRIKKHARILPMQI